MNRLTQQIKNKKNMAINAVAVLICIASIGIGVAKKQYSDNESQNIHRESSSLTTLLNAQSNPINDLPTIQAAQLSKQAQITLDTIANGGPYEFKKDGTIFFNREGILPHQSRGYYREYTVAYPNATNRGKKRIVCGGSESMQRKLSDCYYTEDHYNSFWKIIGTEKR